MSDFKISGNVNPVNLQMGDYNKMETDNKIIVDWDKLKTGFENIDTSLFEHGEMLVVRECLENVENHDVKKLRNIMKNHLGEIGKNIFCGLASGALVELLKVLLV